MSKTEAMLVPSDEGFNHQIAETFAVVSQSDRSWTEKVCGAFFKKDGSLAIGWGLGKYTNRNVMDGYAGVSRGVEQWTVRASRMLFPTPDQTAVGPIHYELLEPLKKIRLRLDANATQPIAFDVVFDGAAIPPFMENHKHRRQVFGFRTETDLCRYHQVGSAEGWVMVPGHGFARTVPWQLVDASVLCPTIASASSSSWSRPTPRARNGRMPAR